MENLIINKDELLVNINNVVSQLDGLMLPLDNNKINAVPYKDSWTAGQLFRHVSKVMGGFAKAIVMRGKPADRDAGERVLELKKTFLDFSSKMESPEMVMPENGPYDKEKSLNELKTSFEQLKENSRNENLDEITENPNLGPMSKLEMLHFVWYHTQRHLHQMEKICEAL